MNRTLIIAILVSSVVAPSAMAHAQSELMGWRPTGTDLVAACGAATGAASPDATTAAMRVGECFAFIQGTLGGFWEGEDTALTKADGSMTTREIANVPNGVTDIEVAKVILAYLDKHPEKLHLGASHIVYWAIRSAWGTEKPETYK